MLIKQPPMITETSHNTCGYHKRYPGKNYAGCTCSGSFSLRVKPIEDWTEYEKKWYFCNF